VALQKLEIVFEFDGITAYDICLAILGLLKKRSLLPRSAKLYGQNVLSEALASKIRESNKTAFHIELDSFSFHFASVRAFSHDLLEIRQKEASLPIGWDEWVSLFLSHPAFIQAWVSDIEYVRWQNAEDLLEYEAAGKSIANLRMKSNGLPPPLDQQVIDISANPSRRIICKGYVEAIGGVMWLSPKFLKRARTSIEEIRQSAAWLKVEQRNDGVLRLEADGGVFKDRSTEIIQKRLRSVLFQ